MSLSLLKAEIEQKKRKPTEDPTASAPPARKWVKRGEIEAQREQEYRKRQMEKEQLRKVCFRLKASFFLFLFFFF
jgi:hypothetical protein